ncbi:hypothetical protein JCM9279_000975 [Rhodotorula babjevae]
MLALWLVAAAAACAAATVAAESPSSPPPSPAQLAFTAPRPPPQLDQAHHSHLYSFEWNDRPALERAARLFAADDLDLAFAGRRTRDRQPRWEAVVRLDGHPGHANTHEAVVDRLVQLGMDKPDAGHHLPLADHLSTLDGSTSYARALSAAAIANLTASSSPPTSPLDTVGGAIHDTYHPYGGLHDILVSLERAYPDWVRVISVGKSSEGRDIWGVKVTNHSSSAAAPNVDEDEEDADEGPAPLVFSTSSSKRHKHKRSRKLGFVVSGTQHAREWIAASTVLYLAHDLVAPDARGKTPHHKLLNSVEFTFIPVVNPDGYVYSWDHDRLWRKSRQPVGSPSPSSSSTAKACYGIDLNRNWGKEFQRGTRPNPCSDSYPGREAFESVELQALKSYLLDDENHVDAFFDVHSFGQMLLFPYSYSCDVRTADEENHYEAVLQAAKALKGVHGRQFETGSVCEISLTSPGMSLDWTYASAKIRWSFGAELRDGGVFGFLLPPSQIRPSGEEMSAALRSLTQFILDKEDGKR